MDRVEWEVKGTEERTWRASNLFSVRSDKRLQIETCQCCLRSLEKLGDNENLEIHHVIPVKDGGADTLDNIWVPCTTCHKEVHHRRVYFNGHMEKFFKAYLAVQRMTDAKESENGK